jgi:hypothetical protein
MTATATSARPFDDLINLLVETAPEKVLLFRASKQTVDRLYDLIEKEKNEGLDATEKAELDKYLMEEDLIIIAKAKARLKLQQAK